MVVLFHYLSLLNLFDAFITYFGLVNEYIEEANPIMGHLYETNPAFFLLTKIGFSVCLYLFILFKKVPSSTLIKGLTVFASSSYTVIFFLHFYWLTFTV